MSSLIDKLTELHGKATRGEWKTFVSHNRNYIQNEEKIIVDASGWIPEIQEEYGIEEESDAEYIVALSNAFPLIKQHFEATERLVTQLQQDSDSGDCGYSHTRELAEFREAIKDL